MWIIKLIGVENILNAVKGIYSWWRHRKKSIDLLDHDFFPFMEREIKDKLPYHIIEMTVKDKNKEEILLRQELLQCFFPIKVKMILDKTRDVCLDFQKTKKLNLKSSDIMDWCYLYSGRSNKEWRKHGKKNNAMALFTEKFHEIHESNIIKTQDRIEYILNKDISDYQKLDRILDTLRWAFKLSLPYVLNASESLNGSLTRELKKA